jgi:hypothetical protein
MNAGPDFNFQRSVRRAIVLVALLFVCAIPPRSHAQALEPPSGNRWLLIVDTSRLMQHRAEAAQQIAASLIDSGMQGQMRDGDTLGLWTFNDSLSSGVFPLQEWTTNSNTIVARRVYEFLRAQKNERESRFEKVSPEMAQVIQDSEFITVIVISDGSSAMTGTPFDAKINASYKEWQKQQQENQMPFITLLRAKAGVFTDFVVNTPPFPLEFPPLPEELLKPKTSPRPVASQKPETEKARPVTTLPPLILSGRKPEPIEPQVPAPADPVVQPEVPQAITETKPEPLSLASADGADGTDPTPARNTTVSKPEVSSLPSSNPVHDLPQNQVLPPNEDPIQQAVTLETNPGRKTLWLVAAAIVALLAAGLYFFNRRNRATNRASLITRSLDREQR